MALDLHPLNKSHVDYIIVDEPRTIQEILDERDLTGFFSISLNGELIKEEFWDVIVVGDDDFLSISMRVEDSDALRIVAAIVITVVAVATGNYLAAEYGLSALAQTAVTATIAVVGNLAVNALIPVQLNQNNRVGRPDDPRFIFSGSRNEARPYQPIPIPLGFVRMYPPYLAIPYTEFQDNEQYLVLLFTCGYGALEISDLKIGETPIDEFSDITYEVDGADGGGDPITLYTKVLKEDSLSIVVSKDGGSVVRTSDFDVEEISVDIVFAQGLIGFTKTGVRGTKNVDIRIEYRAVGDSDWTVNFNDDPIYSTGTISVTNGSKTVTGSSTSWVSNISPTLNRATADYLNDKDYIKISGTYYEIDSFSGETITLVENYLGVTSSGLSYEIHGGFFRFIGKTTSAVRHTIKWDVTKDQYEVRLTRLTDDPDKDRIRTVSTWTMLRSIQKQPPVTEPNLSQIAVRIKATEQLNSVVDTFNCMVKTKIPDYDSVSDTWITRVTQNPASLYRHLLQGNWKVTATDDAKLDLDELEDWHTNAADNSRFFNGIIESSGVIFTRLSEVCSVGRAAFGIIDGLFSVIQDKVSPPLRQYITPQNSRNFKWNRVFVDLPHAFEVRFHNEDEGFQPDFVYAFDDGYDETNSSKYEVLNYIGISKKDQAWREGRYQLAQAKLRPEEMQVEMDIEHLNCTRGSRIRSEYDVALIGGSAAFLDGVTAGGSDYTLDLSNSVTMEAGKSYKAYIRKANTQNESVVDIVLNVGEQTSIVTTTKPTGDLAPEVGDLIIFGESSSAVEDFLVKDIRPMGDLAAVITLVPLAPAIHEADRAPIPEFSPTITISSRPEYSRPNPPTIIAVRSDETASQVMTGGIVQPLIRVLLQASRQEVVSLTATHYETNYRLTDESEGWKPVPDILIPGTEVQIPEVLLNESYDIRVRAVDKTNNRFSNWAYHIGHTVVGSSLAPPSIDSLRIEGGWLKWDYPDKPNDFLGFKVRFSNGQDQSWSRGTDIHTDYVKENQFNLVGYLASGVRTFLVKAYNSCLCESTDPAVLYFTGYPEYDRSEITSYDFADNGFPGTITDGTVSGDDLEADQLTVDPAMWKGDSAAMWEQDPTSNMWATLTYKKMIYSFEYTPSSGGLNSRLFFNPSIDGFGVTVEHRIKYPAKFWSDNQKDDMWSTDSNDDMWGNVEGVFKKWSGSIEPATLEPHEFRITTLEKQTRGVILTCKTIVDSTLSVERINDMFVSSAGSRILLQGDYSEIEQVNIVAIQSDGGGAVSTRVVDKSKIGPLIEALDSDGNLTTATLDVEVKGY